MPTMVHYSLKYYAVGLVMIFATLSVVYQSLSVVELLSNSTLLDLVIAPSIMTNRSQIKAMNRSNTQVKYLKDIDVLDGAREQAVSEVVSAAGDAEQISATDEYDPSTRPIRNILFYNRFWYNPMFRFGLGGPEIFEKAKCPVTRCSTSRYEMIKNKSAHDFDQYDAVIFSIEHVDLNLDDAKLAEINTWRKPHHRFVLFGYENPGRQTGTKKHFNGFFNWTLTYRTDSDVRLPYGWFNAANDTSDRINPQFPTEWPKYDESTFINKILPKHKETFTALAKRPKKIAWLVSSCRLVTSKRSQFVNVLRKYIDIDIMGLPASKNAAPCHKGTIPCDKRIGTGPDNCTRAIRNDYKFYLSFENSLCEDYVTEKVFDRIENSLIITMNQANMSKQIPPHSSVSMFDYNSAKELADYIHYLDKNDTAYMSYFWWRDHYRVTSMYETDPSFCLLCDRLHQEEAKRLGGTPSPPKVYDDILGWWWEAGQCSRTLPIVEEMIAKG